jgi:hypothetical protein
MDDHRDLLDDRRATASALLTVVSCILRLSILLLRYNNADNS